MNNIVDSSNKLKHLEFLQSTINRMAGNLFLLKGWSITLIAALFALAAKDTNKAYAALAYFPLLMFWTLDGYFLSQERCFRSLYDHVRRLDESQIDFSMDTRPGVCRILCKRTVGRKLPNCPEPQ